LTTFCLNRKNTGKKKNSGEPHCPFSHTNLA
jgi:hypothetical protein